MARIEIMTEVTPGPGSEGVLAGSQAGPNIPPEQKVNTQPADTPGVSASVEAVRQAGYIQPPEIRQVPESVQVIREIRNQLAVENPLNPEGKSPAAVVEILQTIDTMSAEQREEESIKSAYQQACDVLKEYAHKSKLLGLEDDIIKLERKLNQQDEEEIQKQPPEKQQVLQQLLDNFDATREESRRLSNTLKEDGLKALYSDKDWRKKQEAEGKLKTETSELEQQITAMTSPDFLDVRKKSEDGIKQEKEKLAVAQREKQEKKVKQRRAEPEKWEKELEEILLRDAEPTITEPGSVAATFSLQLAEFQKQQFLSETNDPNFVPANLEMAQKGLSWYFHEARRRGIFGDLEERLEHKYIEWRNSMVSHREVSQMDMLTGSPGRLPRKTFAEVEDEILEYFDSLLNESKPQFVENAARWDRLQRRGMLPPAAKEALQGIRIEFVRRAQAQIIDSLSGATLPARILGEWNVRGVERAIAQQREQQVLEEGMEPLYQEESYYKIRLLGTNRQQIELGADQAADNIIQSATTFDLNTIQQRMEMLLKAIREKSVDLQRSEKVSEKDAKKMMEQIEDSVTNKIDFFILDWAGRNLQMELFSSYMEQRLRIRGVEKLRRLPAMSDGLTGIALYLFMDPKFRLYFRPQGFKGQLFDDDTTHKYIRELLKEQMIGLLMQYKLKGVDEKEQSQNREKLTNVSSLDEFLSCFDRRESPKAILDQAEKKYQEVLKRVEESKDKSTFEDLEGFRGARSELARVQSIYEEIERKATSAFEVAEQVMNVFGESAMLGAPSIVMDNGDYISVQDAVLFYKYAILQKAKENWKQDGVADNLALIRWRSKKWIRGWKDAGLNRAKAPRKFKVSIQGGKMIEFELQEGFQETGLTKEEWQAFSAAVTELRQHGHTAKIGAAKFEDIIKMNSLKPVMNNFLADYKSSESQINNEVVLEQVAKGRLIPIQKILRRLGLKGREGIKGDTTQQRIDNLTQMIEDSRAFDAELERLAYFEATHGLPQPGKDPDPRMLPFSADRIDYGFQGMNWGVKRLQHLKAFWYTNLRRTMPRAADLVHAMPFSLGSLSREMDFDSILDLALSVNTTANGMESVDNPALTMYAQRFKDMLSIRGREEGSLAEEQGGGLKKLWGFLEKPLVDANSLWKVFGGIKFKLDDFLKNLTNKENDNVATYNLWRENIVNYLQETTFKRFEPIIAATEKLLGEDRQALSSGAGYEENEKFALRFLEWLISEKGKGEKRDDIEREQGGIEANTEIRDIIRLITTPSSYREGSSIWTEVWRKMTPSHNPRLPGQVPPPTYV
ncbi:hypothetical protein HYU45_00885 [Candidatus Daviesbacteria bacterium]|nr:hypothetical protein [Candidatus Daviesbacteria bacterium]